MGGCGQGKDNSLNKFSLKLALCLLVHRDHSKSAPGSQHRHLGRDSILTTLTPGIDSLTKPPLNVTISTGSPRYSSCDKHPRDAIQRRNGVCPMVLEALFSVLETVVSRHMGKQSTTVVATWTRDCLPSRSVLQPNPQPNMALAPCRHILNPLTSVHS